MLDEMKLKSYVDKLVEMKVGPDGILAKLDRFLLAINYITRDVPHLKPMWEVVKQTSDRIRLWMKKNLRMQSKRLQKIQ